MEVIGLINRGGFGRVEEVLLADGTVGARKVFDPTPEVLGAADATKLKKRFRREVRVQSSLSSDYFIPVLGYDLECDEPWFVMPLCEMNYFTKIEEDRANRTITQEPLADILNALEELHSLGYTHRDLKPQNILLHNGRWKLSDFGLVLPPTGETTMLTSTNSVWGTHMYSAPEQTLSFRTVTSKADIYSFGCILHDIFGTGPRVPYQQHTCAGPVGMVVEKCTEVNPVKRFKSITAVRGVLLSTLAQPITIGTSHEAEEWVASLEGIAGWQPERVGEFARYIRQREDSADIWSILSTLDEERLRSLRNLDSDAWEEIALSYCDWINRSRFTFEYCDVLVRRLECIFEIGSMATKASAVLAAAELGTSHNRWFVMKRLMGMCDHSLDDAVARRIAIEIAVEEAELQFRLSAQEIGRSVDGYHPTIAGHLKNDPDLPLGKEAGRGRIVTL